MRIAVIQGGPSSEAEVSRTSAAAVAGALANDHEVARIELDRALAGALLAGGFDVVFPVVHGALGEDGSLQGLLEVLGLPYVGSGVLASALAMDKPSAKKLFRAAALPVAEEAVVRRGTAPSVAAREVRDRLGPAVVVKPGAQGSAIGVARIGRAATDDELAAAIEAAFAFDDVLLCERFVEGREVTCGVTDLPALGGPRALPPTEIRAKMAEFYDFRSRYAAGGSEHVCPADLPPGVAARVQEIALAAHLSLGCRDLSRADFVVGDGDDLSAVTLLEVNTLPGMTATSLYPEAMAKSGYDFRAMCNALVAAARARGTRAARPVLAMPLGPAQKQLLLRRPIRAHATALPRRSILGVLRVRLRSFASGSPPRAPASTGSWRSSFRAGPYAAELPARVDDLPEISMLRGLFDNARFPNRARVFNLTGAIGFDGGIETRAACRGS